MGLKTQETSRLKINRQPAWPQNIEWLWQLCQAPPTPPTTDLLDLMAEHAQATRIEAEKNRAALGVLRGFKVVRKVNGRYLSTYPYRVYEYTPKRLLYELAQPDHRGGLFIHSLSTLENTIQAFQHGTLLHVEPGHYAVLRVQGWGQRYFYDDDGYCLPCPSGGIPGNYRKVAVSWLYVDTEVATIQV